ncbi:hypothetical protein [Craterilacuibacter sinensis]|uniref:Uncharacterized protein n=1 Tax=Craterilacuibacter sinensis TaxID=2686017 RepID=A0A845BLL9_9NEIS|nr:hypothetical protein [Craterilacuibacter sinensis]MXR36118.1 hypothetical protein [Craterilacuibacter sinensis]
MESFKLSGQEGLIGTTIQIVIDKEAWLTRNKFEISSDFVGFIPKDALGARGKADEDKYPARGVPVDFDYGIVQSKCDIATRSSGVMRPRDNSGMSKFLKYSNAKIGDVVCITKTGERSFKIALVRR